MTSWQRRSRVELRQLGRRIRARLAETSRVMIVGVAVFLTGFGLNLLRPPADDGGSVSIVRAVNRLVDTANNWLPSRLTDPETRQGVNILMVAMLSESLPPEARARLEGVLTSTRSFFGNLFTLKSLVTLFPVVGLYFLVARWLDRWTGLPPPELAPAPAPTLIDGQTEPEEKP